MEVSEGHEYREEFPLSLTRGSGSFIVEMANSKELGQPRILVDQAAN